MSDENKNEAPDMHDALGEFGVHIWVWEVPYQSTGPNIFGEIVTCWGCDGTCSHCSTGTWKRVDIEENKV